MTLTKLAPGARVIIRDEEWLVKRTEGKAVRALGLSELVKNREAVFLTEIDDIQELRPEDTVLDSDTSPQFARSRLYLESLLRRTPPTDSKLYLGQHGALNYTPYQATPTNLALNALRPRILIADGVGLGKTVEVGILLSELIKRGRGDRILVIAIKSMLAQFQQEIWSRFSIPLVRLDSVGIQRVRAKIPANKNPFYHYNRAIISVDTLKNDAQYRHFLEQAHWDVIVIDECHNVANAGSQRNRLATLLSRTCDSLILTSATPHNGKPESFANLMTMLEPTAIADPSNYAKEEIDGMFVRRFKKDVDEQVQAHFQTRQIELKRRTASAAESRFFDALNAATFNTQDALYRIGLFKEFLSSPAACVATLDNRLRNIERRLEERADPQNAERTYRRSVADLHSDRATLSSLRELADAVTLPDFSKFQLLLALLHQLDVNAQHQSPRLIIFSERLATLQFLQEQLQSRFSVGDDQIKQFHAGLPDTEQQTIVEDFGKEDSPIRILLASDAASEGVNLHYYCHLMIHFDIPWSLIRLEQRNGRIDRYGQTSVPRIFYLLTESNNPAVRGDLRILDKLIEKEEEAHKNIGDAAALLKLYDAAEEEAIITQAVADSRSLDDLIADEDDEDDFLALLFGDADDASHDDGIGDELLAAAPSLFKDDLDFASAAFDELKTSDPHLALPEWHPERPEFTFTAPDDLKRRLDYIPQEGLPDYFDFRLSTDREAIMRAMAAARKQQGVWPSLQLFWELHPVMEWMLDRLMVTFGRNHAPLIPTPHLPASRAVFLMQGIVSNKRSQPIITDWFGIQRDLNTSADNHTILTFDDVMAQTRFHRGLPNAQQSSPHASAVAHRLTRVVMQGRDHMGQQRMARADELRQRLRDDQRKLNAWREHAIAQIDAALMSASKAKTAQLERERDHVKKLYKERGEWLREVMATDPNPYIRIAAVFVGG